MKRGLARSLLAPLAAALSWLVPLTIALALMFSGAPIADRLRDLMFDEYQRLSPRPWNPELPVRIIAIDDEAISAYGQWPWPRARFAELTQRLNEGGAAVIAYDILFSEDDRLAPEKLLGQLPASPARDALEQALASRTPEESNPLAAAFTQAPVVNAFTLINEGVSPPAPMKTSFVILGDDPGALPRRFPNAVLPLPDLREAGLGLGAINYVPDRDLTIRRAPLVLGLGARGEVNLVPSLALEALRVAQSAPAQRAGQNGESPIIKATGASMERNFGAGLAIVSIRIGEFIIPTEADGQVRIRFSGSRPERYISAARVLNGSVAPGEIEGRILLVGATAASLGDIRSTPIEGATPGVEVHAELLEHAITGANLSRPDFMLGVEAFVLALGGLVTAFLSQRVRGLAGVLGVLLLATSAACASWYLFVRLDTLFDPLISSMAWFAAWGSTSVAVYRRTEKERRTVRTAFSRYLAPAVVERLAADPSQLKLGGELRNITVMFCDVRGFTARAEKLNAEGVVEFLNSLMTPLTRAVLAHGGTIDKYMGDGLMAFWNAPLDTPDHAARACKAALAMLDALPAVDAFNARIAAAADRAHIPVRIGVGLNTGDVFVGNMGSEQRFDYSIIGDPVNVAARLESATKEFGAPIVVSEDTMRAAAGLHFVYVGQLGLRGRQEKTRVYALHGEKGADDAAFFEFSRLHARVIDALEQGSNPCTAIEVAQAHPLGHRYAEFYATRKTPDSDES